MTDNAWYFYGGIGSLAIGALCYRIYGNRHAYYEVLKNIKCYNVDDDLSRDLLQSNNHINYAAVTGLVVADGDCIINQDGNKGVIRHQKILQHTKEWSGRLKVWMKDVRELSAQTETKPFSITNRSGNICVSVSHPLEVSHPITDILVQTHQEFEPVDSSLLEKVVNVLSSSYVTGFEKVESMLETGTQLTVLGEIGKTLNGIYVGPPDANLKYVMTKLSLRKAKENEKFWLDIWKYASILFAGFGLFLISAILFRKIKKYLNDRRFRKLAEENNRNNDASIDCVICMENRRNVVFLPCGHICVCKNCGDICEKCPICRIEKQKLVPTFVS